ncbi:uncharacterized protein FTJAE_13079 [Fusarium tjaetaba]|uniref:Uncharacterized protein n=1 Tax=Fusarium tjaetaba TaxID=1567544 RepID=A0A8H5QHQ5_9HYPO|nr:uncharacterized protein FTJAE_13079 [Fusarium tjaetaba]KAF5616136.1 hypothetical protein FTJAE_13079 [Fusarium tjaetaba]
MNNATVSHRQDWSSDPAQGGADGCAGAQTDDPSQPDKGPVQIVDISPQISRLGQWCGIETKCVGYCLHRGAAYVLAMNASDDMRRFLMGHKPGNNTYARHYQAKVSKVDFPPMLCYVVLIRSLSTFSQGSALLNRSDNAPLALSSNGLARVMALPDVVKEDKKLASSREKILQEHPSINEARRHAGLLAGQYDDTTATRRSCID